ncbi:MAG: mechanosensitive ion channel family protein [Bacteroidota bacterium]
MAYVATLSVERVGPISTPELKWLLAAFYISVGSIGVQAVRYFVLDVLFLRTQGHRAPALLHGVVALVLYFVLTLVIASQVFEQPLTGAIATSAVASVVIGLALQETLGNFFAGISLQVEQPFRLGDVIQAGDVKGRVETFNWRATTLQTVSGSRVVIPNSVVAREACEVLARTRVARHGLLLSAPYEAPPQQIISVVRGAVMGVPGISERPVPQVRLASFDDSSVGYEVLYWVEDPLRVAAIDAQIRERIWYAFARNDISIPFPHEVHVPYVPPVMERSENPCEERARWLGEVALFAPLSPEERRRLADDSRTLLYGPGETILRAGAEGGSLFVVQRGRVEIRVPQEDGRRVRVAEMMAGEVLGEMSLLTGEPRSADVRALGEVQLVEVRRAGMRSLLEENEALADAIAHEMACRLDARADALAATASEAEMPMSQASLLHRIRRFFDL